MAVDVHKLIDAVAKVVADGNWDNPIVRALAHASPTMFLRLADESDAIPQDDKYRIVMLDDGGQKIVAIKLIRELTGLGLAEAKQFVESLPQTVDFKLRRSSLLDSVCGTELTQVEVDEIERIVTENNHTFYSVPWDSFRVEKV